MKQQEKGTDKVVQKTRLDVYKLTEDESAFMDFLEENMVGQPQAKKAALRIFRAIHNPLRDPNRPIFSTILAGESRTGKNHLVRLLARWFHGNEKALVKVNGGEFQERYALNRLIGSPHGYIGHNDASDPARKPADGKKDTSAILSQHNLDFSRTGSKYDVVFVLFDEWEKMHRNMINLLLSGLDEGEFTLANNEDVNFRNVVVVMTSNMGMSELEQAVTRIGFGSDLVTGRQASSKEVETAVRQAFKKNSSPEFRNRIDMLVVYEKLNNGQLKDIVSLEFKALQARIMATCPSKIFAVEASEEVKDHLLALALASEEGGLANLKRVINQYVLEPLGTVIRLGSISMGDLVTVGLEDGAVVFDRLKSGAELNAFKEIPIIGQGTVDLTMNPLDGASGLPSMESGGALIFGLPTYGGYLMNLSELMFLQRAQELKLLAQIQSPLMAEYELSIAQEDSLDKLTATAFRVVRDLTDLLGVKVLSSETSYVSPYLVSLKVKALPGQVDLLKLRYSDIKVKLIG